MARCRREARDNARALPASGAVLIFRYYDGSTRTLTGGAAAQ
jgi:hypothetical protein